MPTHHMHHGHNIKRLREIQGVKQSALALELGEGWNQKKISLLESRPIICRELLEQIAKVLGVSAENIENFRDEVVCKHLVSMTPPHLNSAVYGGLELVEKLLELLEENRALYHCLLEAEKGKNQLLERMLAERRDLS